MNIEEARILSEKLQKQIKYHNDRYYNKDAPEISDYEYDMLLRSLEDLEAQFPQLITEESPTQKVGGRASQKFAPVVHSVPMESLHDAFSEDKLVYLGDTSRKTPVKVNKTVYESDIKVTIGKVELHDMAGFSGGRKSILPGVCAEETIVINHRPEKMIDPNSRAGNLENNPIHEDMLETARMCGVDYSVNIVMNMDYEIAGIFSGDLDLSHRAAAEFLKKYCNVELPKKPDVFVVCPGKPLSIDMYQGVKAIIAFHKITDSNTTVILYGSFEEGINSKDFYEPFKKYKDLDELKKFVWENYEIQMDHIIPIMEMLKKKTKIVVITENVSKEEIEDMGMKKAESLQTAVDEALGGEKEKLVAICPQSYRCIFSIKK